MGGETKTSSKKRARAGAAQKKKQEEVKLKRKKDFDANQKADAPSSGGSDEEPFYNPGMIEGASALDTLLKTLKNSGSQKVVSLYKKRERKQKAISDSEDDDGSSDEEKTGRGHDESSDGHDMQDNPDSQVLESIEENNSEDEYDTSDGDEEHDVQSTGNDAVEESETSSSFYCHFGRVLTNEEVDKLMNQKCRFKWEMPAASIPMSKWVGTGQQIQGNNVDFVADIKGRLFDHWQNIFKSSWSDLNSSRLRFFSLCNSYRDIMHCNKKPFYLKGSGEDSNTMDAYIMHALNHVYRTRDRVIKNDAKLAKNDIKVDIVNDDAYLDQGFTRPKVLILLPIASIALRVVKRLIQLAPLSKKGNVGHLGRFKEQFEAGDPDDETEEQRSENKNSAKPADFKLLFSGNNDDHFMLGIKFTKKSMKLYSDFYSSDIIVASPLGLITKIGEVEVEKEKDVDYLSSIEIVIIDHADMIAMQNWSHVHTIFEKLNCLPSKQHGTDVMRIRPWYLNGHARFYRQTILLGLYLNPDINALFNRLCVNYEGKVKLVTEHKGILPKILLQVRQVYQRFHASSIVEADDARLDYFSKKVYPKIRDSNENGVLIFTSSYFEFVRIRNFLKSQDASFCLLGEYTKQSDISRARLWFFEGKRKIMLYTERAHFYHRYKIRGIQNLIVYSLPERKEFYPEILNMLDGSKNMVCNVLFSQFDHLRLEQIVGTSAAKRMSSSEKNMFVFC